nr:uncharacterized protein C12orf71 homolog [Camelus dromedarius]XP_031299652.1 uncharacterized protein C12orf71 homolog [Camelus dromedarius]XP_031304518.1 uncharacterized protein C12orf71 homolog [Camelus dromedarius]
MSTGHLGSKRLAPEAFCLLFLSETRVLVLPWLPTVPEHRLLAVGHLATETQDLKDFFFMAQELATPLSRGQPPEQSVTQTTAYPWDEGDLQFAPWNAMVPSFSSSSESSLSVSVGYFPCEDTFSYENTISNEDTPPEGPSGHFVPPLQGTWRTENIGRLLGRRDQTQDDPEQFCKLSITLAWDVDVASDNSDSTANWDPRGDNQWTDKCPKEKTPLTRSKLDGLVQKLEEFLENQKEDEDDDSLFPESAREEEAQLPSSSPPGMAQVSHLEDDTCQDLATFNPAEKEDVIQFPQTPPRPWRHELAEIISQATGSQRTRTAGTSSPVPVSAGPPEEEDTASCTRALSCLHLGWIFRWLRQQVLSSRLRRGHPKKATESSRQLPQKARFSHRSKRIQPQEPLKLGHPVSPDF